MQMPLEREKGEKIYDLSEVWVLVFQNTIFVNWNANAHARTPTFHLDYKFINNVF